MNFSAIEKELEEIYKGKKEIFRYDDSQGGKRIREVVVEIDPTSLHKHYSIALALIERSHKHSDDCDEIFIVVKGTLKIHLGNGLSVTLKERGYLNTGGTFLVAAGNVHQSEGIDGPALAIVISLPGHTSKGHHILQEEQ